jgi:hypothetical protein
MSWAPRAHLTATLVHAWLLPVTKHSALSASAICSSRSPVLASSRSRSAACACLALGP